MREYNYYEAVENDVRKYIENEIDLNDWKGQREELEEKLHDDLWVVDSVTGNGSGSYTFSAWQAEENLCHNTELLKEALEEFECGIEDLKKGAESLDVTIRCYLLGQSIAVVLDELEENGAF